MIEILKTLRDTPLPSILVIGGLVFLLLPFLRKTGGGIEIDSANKGVAAIIGIFLLASGIALYILPLPAEPVTDTNNLAISTSQLTQGSIVIATATIPYPTLPATADKSLPPTLTPLGWAIEASFIVQANQPWQSTGVEIKKGDFLEIVYLSGKWTGRSSSPGLSGPDFGPSPENTNECYPIRGEGASLIGKIGNGSPFKVGYQYIGNPVDTGMLYLRMNDCDAWLFDNAGSITVIIRVRR